jgi:hypothetical protein
LRFAGRIVRGSSTVEGSSNEEPENDNTCQEKEIVYAEPKKCGSCLVHFFREKQAKHFEWNRGRVKSKTHEKAGVRVQRV